MGIRSAIGRFGIAFSLCASIAAPAFSADYPSRPITLVVSQAAGGGNDLVARLLAEKLSKRMGVNVVVENRVGAGGVVAVTSVAHAAPDGYTLLLLGNSDVVNQYLHENVQYNVQRDFTPISLITTSPLFLIRNSAYPSKTLAEVVSDAKANPGKVSVGSPGVGTVHHISIELLGRAAHINLVHVPYQGTMPSMTDLLADHIPLIIANLIAVLPSIKAGTIHPIAVAGKDRSPLLPDVPTYSESGTPMADIVSQSGIAIPAGAPPAIIERLSKEVRAVAADPTFRTRIIELGSIVGGGSSEDYSNQLSADARNFGQLIPSMHLN